MFLLTLYYSTLYFLGDLAFCIAMYLTYHAIINISHWLNPQPSITTPASISYDPYIKLIHPIKPNPKVKRRHKRSKLAGTLTNSHILSIIKG